MANIIAIDDEKSILQVIKKCLEKNGHSVAVYENVCSISSEQVKSCDLMILDVVMPGVNGFEFCKKIRSVVDFPIIFLTAKVLDDDITYGLDIGADDYITKPFRIAELRSRVEAHIRRENRSKRHRLVFDYCHFDLDAKTIFVGNGAINLTKSEYNICEYLAKNKGHVLSREQIYVGAIDSLGESDNSTILTHIKNIRLKFEKHGLNPITTVWGVGYKWN